MSMKIPAVLSGLVLSSCLTLALDWKQGNGFRSAALVVPQNGRTGFTLLSPSSTGILFTNFLSEERYRANQVLLNGSGVAAGDVDGDGWCDLYFCRLEGPNALYRNLGDWRFEDITASAGVLCPDLDATGSVLADVDGDRDLDLVVNSVGGGTHIFLNDGKGRFAEITRTSPLNPGKGATSLALGDIDGDGDLDLYIANYRTSALMDMPNTRFNFKKVDGKQVVVTVNGRPVTEPDLVDRFVVNARGGIDEMGEPDMLYRNAGGTNFVAVSFTDGSFLDEDGKPLSKPPLDWGLSVMIRDINQDGLPDIYVCNDFNTPERIWINQGGARFRAAGRLAMRKACLFSMGVDFADINRDGQDDFFVLDMLSRDRVHRLTTAGDRAPSVPVVGQIDNRPEYMMNTLFLNRGDGTYAEMAQLSGVAASEWSWATLFLDVDLDGWEDILVSNGHERAARHLDVMERLKTLRAQKQMSNAEILEARKIFPRLATANVAFRNRRDLTFEEVGKPWGFDFVGVSHGMALADLDNDGDLDVIVNNLNDPAGVLRNETSATRVAVRLKGQAPNTAGIGARIKVVGGPVTQSQEMLSGGRYLSSDDPMRVFAAGPLTSKLTLEVTWRSGKRSVVSGAQPNHVYEIEENSADVLSNTPPEKAGGMPAPFFTDVSHLLKHTHAEEPFDDFARQPLLPNKLSQLGPGISWCDVDGDGWEDLIVASGRSGQLAVHKNNARGGFTRLEGPPFNQPVTRDQTTVLGWPRASGQIVLLAGSANYEDGLTLGSCVRQYDLAKRTVEDILPPSSSSTGPLAMADLDGDGDLDLFVGGRVLPGRYPEAASSTLFRNSAGTLGVDSENTRRLQNIGMVSGAVFSDLDGDGDPDLILACEWGPVKVFANEGGKLTEATDRLGLGKFNGWWNGVTTGDFDSDGRMDIVASNWGRNTRHEMHRSQPLQVAYGDLDGDGTLDLVESHVDVALNKRVPERGLDFLSRAMPFVRERFSTHEAYARAGLEEIFGDRLKAAKKWEAAWLESTLFLNRGDHFVAKVLPMEAQISPAFGVCAGDYDGDGHEDIFLSQNFFASQPETPRCDGGRGLWLKGDGKGGLTAVDGVATGIKIYGEQRGCALADYDGDGRVDLAVTQNGAETRLYKNLHARAGIRVRLMGPSGNPNGVGATLRLRHGETFGPAREIHAGSGYWSQDGNVQVLAAPELPAQIVVRWPGGKTVTASVPQGAQEMAVDFAGEGKVLP